jgi:hypothetical protein
MLYKDDGYDLAKEFSFYASRVKQKEEYNRFTINYPPTPKNTRGQDRFERNLDRLVSFFLGIATCNFFWILVALL